MSVTEHSPATRVIIFDFDGTVSQGHGPVLEYAKEISQRTDIPHIHSLTRFALEQDEVQIGELFPRDGYDTVQLIARSFDVPEEKLQEAYLASRTSLATTGITPLVGLGEFLAETSWTTVLATNAPTTGITETLDSFGLSSSFDRIVNSVGKPAGLSALLHKDYPRAQVIGVGDIWEFDLAPIAAVSGKTVLIKSQFRQTLDCNPTVSVPNADSLIPTLRSLTER